MKTVAIPEDVHQSISDVQKEIRKKYGINLHISFIVTSVLKKYVRSMEDILKEGFARQDIIKKETEETEIIIQRYEVEK
jgi:hypothetical protein